MARYTGPAFKKSRRLGFSTLENGKDLKRPYAPGMHGNDRRKKLSEYGVQLQEKQKVRTMYGLNEKQFHRLFDKASKMDGITGEKRGARQLVNHGHIMVNGIKVNIPSYTCVPGDVISVKEESKGHKSVMQSLENATTLKAFVTFDKNKLTGTYVRIPDRSELNSEINEALIVEYYNR